MHCIFFTIRKLFLLFAPFVPHTVPYLAYFFGAATQRGTLQVDAIITPLTVSFNNHVDNVKPINGCNSCNCPTPAIPLSAKLRYQKKKLISILNNETYNKPAQALAGIVVKFSGHKTIHRTNIMGEEMTKAQQITSQLPNCFDNTAPSA